jgi:hypothetical protein
MATDLYGALVNMTVSGIADPSSGEIKFGMNNPPELVPK